MKRFWFGGALCLMAVPFGARAEPARKDVAETTRFSLSAREQPPVAGPIEISLGPQAPQLERFAAQELKKYLRDVFHVESAIGFGAAQASTTTFLLGTAAHNPRVRQALGSTPVALAEQAILLRRVSGPGAPTFVIGGGSESAVLWGVYELMERYGVRYLLHGDVLPANPGVFYLPKIDEVIAPNLETRCWRLINGFAMGPESWGLQETDAFIDQLAKMKFNRIHLSLWPWQSYSDFEFHGVRKTTGVSFFGYHFPITPDMVGAGLFGHMTEFENPEFVGTRTYAERHEAARRLARGMLAHGKHRGMEVGITIQPLDFPTEFRGVLPGSMPVRQLGSLTIGPGPDDPIDDPLLADLVATVIRSYVRDYPEADWLNIEMPEHRGWTGQAERAWSILNRKYHLDDRVTVADLRAQAQKRTTYAAGDRAVRELEGDIAALYFFDRVIREKHLLERPGQPDLRLVYMSIAEELLPYLPKMLPARAETLTFVEYTASGVVKQAAVLERIPARQMPTTLIYTLADDNVGVLPQVATHAFHFLNRELREHGWKGYYTRYWMIGELDPTVHYLSRSSWDSSVTPEAAYRDLIGPVCGPAAVAPFSEALDVIETVTTHINEDSISLAFPVTAMLLKHYAEEKWQQAPIPEQLIRDRGLYERALAKMREARAASTPSGYAFLDYYIGRLVFAVDYLKAVEAIRGAGLARKAGRTEEARGLLDATLKEMRAGLEAYAAVARDNSDRGTIAILNEYAYRAVQKTRRDLPAAAPAK